MNDTTNTPPKITAYAAYASGGWEIAISAGGLAGISFTDTDLAAAITGAVAELIGSLILDRQPEVIITPPQPERPPLAVNDMTMRDRFAAQIVGPIAAVPCQTQREVARKAYAIADAMMAEREP